MYDLIKITLLVTLVLGITWGSSESYYQGHSPLLSYDDSFLNFTTQYRRPRHVISRSISKCLTPLQPTNGNWTFFNDSLGVDNIQVDSGTNIVFMCNNGYKLSSSNEDDEVIVCRRSRWNKNVMPTCEQTCEPLSNTKSTTYKCQIWGHDVPCDKATDHTVVTYTCAPYYEPLPGQTKKTSCYGGKWKYTPECIPVCGQRTDSGTKIVNGDNVTRGSYPWVIALYQKKGSTTNFICGGSLISLDVVLTAAHCISQPETGRINSPHDYQVGAGKHYSKYLDDRDKGFAFYDDVDDIKTHLDYRGDTQNFRGDIALLKLKDGFAPSERVQPICYTNLQKPATNSMGLVTGWGYTTPTGYVAEVLQEIALLYNEDEKCFASFEKEFAWRFYISDKFCAGFINQARDVCTGDSGGGIVFRKPSDENTYFIYGVLSIGHNYMNDNLRHCNIQTSAIFTKVEEYDTWIQIHVQNWRKDSKISKKCVTPTQPLNGRWAYTDGSGGPNVPVSVNTILNFTCDDGYELELASGMEQPIRCTDTGEWSVTEMPTCVADPMSNQMKYCMLPPYPPNGRWNYYSDGGTGETQTSNLVPEGTTIEFKCDKGFQFSSNNGTSQISVCLSTGTWTITSIPNCEVQHTTMSPPPTITTTIPTTTTEGVLARLQRQRKEACRFQGRHFCGNRCILEFPAIIRCNGRIDCSDGTDEEGCTSCTVDAFHCDDTKCIRQDQVCDRNADCWDGADEQDCKPVCLQDEYLCDDTVCKPASSRCNGRRDCSDGSDEEGCACRLIQCLYIVHDRNLYDNILTTY